MNPTIAQAREVLKLISYGLPEDIGDETGDYGTMCVQACVSKVFDEAPNSDEPTCVEETIRGVMVGLNDSVYWREATAGNVNKLRGRWLRRCAIAQLGSRNRVKSKDYAKALGKYVIRLMLSEVFKDLAKENPIESALLRKASRTCAKARSLQVLERLPRKHLNDDFLECLGYDEYDDRKASLSLKINRFECRCLEGIDSLIQGAARLVHNQEVGAKYLRLFIEANERALREVRSPGVKLMGRLFPKRRKVDKTKGKMLAIVDAEQLRHDKKEQKRAFSQLKVFNRAVKQHLHVTAQGGLIPL